MPRFVFQTAKTADIAVRILLLYGIVAVGGWAQGGPTREHHSNPATAPTTGDAVWRGTLVHYVLKDGLPIYGGDIVLDHIASAPPATAAGDTSPRAAEPRPRAVGTVYPGYLWPSVNGVHQIPYNITNGNGDLDTAIAEYNNIFKGLIQWVPRTGEADYVDFNVSGSGGAGYSSVGRVEGAQTLGCGLACSVGTFLHEMGHATGLYHEQQRWDHGAYITINTDHIQAAIGGNYGTLSDNDWTYGPYDYASIMHYAANSLTTDGTIVTQSVPPGIPMAWSYIANQATATYSAADRDTIRRIYGAAPTAVTIETNPSGLQIIVDGETITTPQTFAWPLNSSHSLGIPPGLSGSGLQVQPAPYPGASLYYQFGRWNDDGAPSHTISIAPGNGMPGYPGNSPAQTVYAANFVQLVPYSPAPDHASPAGAGTMTGAPAPTSFPGVGQFFVANESVVFTANANPSYSLFNWNGSYYCDLVCLGGASPNPMNLFYWTTLNPAPAFTTSQVTTITTDPQGLQVLVDGKPYYAPHPFTSDPRAGGSAWAPGTTHTVSAVSPQNPWSPNTTYAWSSWSDGQGLTHQITVPAGNSTFTANFATQVGLVLGTNSGTGACAGSVTAIPAGPVAPGASVAFTATPSQGFVFTRWEGALSGSANPSSATVSGEEFVQADFNTVSAPLTIASLSPSVVRAGSGPFNLTINGTGFTTHAAGEWVYIWYNAGKPLYLPATYISSTELQVTIPAANVASPGGIEIIVENFSAAGCWVGARSQLVISALEAPALPLSISGTVTKSGAGLGGVTVTLSGSQTGTATTNASGNYSFAVQAGGGYMVTPSLSGYTFNLPSRSFNNLINSQSNVSFATNPPPALYVSSTHIGNFASGQVEATYTLIVGNADSAGPTSGPVTVSEKAPSGLSLVSMSGIGWSCVSNTCTRTDPLAPGMIYPVITVTVNVATNPVAPVVNRVSVSGGASASATAVDSTNIAPPGPLITAVVNGADFKSEPFSPGAWISVLGQYLGESGTAPTANALTLGGASVSICGISAVLSYNSGPVSANGLAAWQINALVPDAVAGQISCDVDVEVAGQASLPVTVAIASGVMELFQFNSSAGALPVVTHADYSLVGPSSVALTPTKPGKTVIAWATGDCSTPGVDVGGVVAVVAFSGRVAPGLCQVNFVVPNVPSGNNQLNFSTSRNTYSLWVSQ